MPQLMKTNRQRNDNGVAEFVSASCQLNPGAYIRFLRQKMCIPPGSIDRLMYCNYMKFYHARLDMSSTCASLNSRMVDSDIAAS